MIEAAMIWNEPNNKSHWDPEVDPEWSLYADMVIRAGDAIHAINPAVTRVLGGMSPIDPHWVERMRGHGALAAGDVVAVHGFPIDWNLWPIKAWPDKIAEIEAVVPDKPVWVTEVGVGSFGAEEVQVFGVNRTAECCDATAHAEIVTLRNGGKAHGEMRIEGSTLYSTLQPCGMCTFASIWAGVSRIVYGAGREDVHEMYFEDRHLSTLDYVADAYKDDLELVGGVLADECAELYFRPGDDVPEEDQAND